MAIQETMTVSRALIELKTLDKRIQDKTSNTVFCAVHKHNVPTIKGKDVATVEADIRSQYQSLMSMIHRRAAIKAAVVLSNATHTVKINGVTYTVAEAIEMKNHGVAYQKALIKNMLYQFSQNVNQMNAANEKLQQAAENYVTGLYGSKEKTSTKEARDDLERYIESNRMELVNPLDIETLADKHRDEIDAFMDEVDSAITVSNATTTIDVKYDVEPEPEPEKPADSASTTTDTPADSSPKTFGPSPKRRTTKNQ